MKKKVILAVGAHPDDMDFGASGTIAKFVNDGAEVYHLVCTDGSRGSSDPKMTHRKLVAIRRKEQIAAAKNLGVKKVFFLGRIDTQLVSDLKLKEEIVRHIRKLKPNVVVTMDPTFYYSSELSFINHTDHREAALATMDACFPLSRDRLTFPEHEKEGLKPHRVGELWFINFAKPDYLVDISKTFSKKLKALSMHKSQFGDLSKIKKEIAERARKLGGKKFKYAESFVRIKMP